MSDDHDATRRAVIAALATLPLANLSQASATLRPATLPPRSRTLVAWFSRSGNTRVIAGVIQRTLKSDQFEIVPATAYPDDYFHTVEQARMEQERGIKPALKEAPNHLDTYQTIYLGFPVWGTRIPPVVQSFLRAYPLAGKLLIPFITHGGYGTGTCETMLAQLAPDARRAKPLVMACDQERRTTETVVSWLETIRS